MRAAGVAAANCTCSVWEGFDATCANIGAFRRLARDNADLVELVHTSDELDRVIADGTRTGLVIGFQNLAALEGNLDLVDLFSQLGLRVAQLTYNTTNLVGSGCYESHDGGLTDYGHDVVEELNRVGIVIDLSHVGRRTVADAIAASRKPVVFSHVAPAALREHRRNRTDEEMRSVAESGGLVGVTFFPWFLSRGRDSTLEDYLDAIEHTIDVAGEDHAAIGSDFMQDQSPAFVEWIMRNHGTGRMLVDTPPGELDVTMPRELSRIEDLGGLAPAMRRRGWREQRIEKLHWANWRRVAGEVWAA
jgi:membrane dipeptidase